MDPRPNLVPLKSRLLATPSNFALSRAEEMRAIDEYRERLILSAMTQRPAQTVDEVVITGLISRPG